MYKLDDHKLDISIIRALGRSPNAIVKRINFFINNGYCFHTQRRDKSKKTQIFSVIVDAKGMTYYGKINVIIELDYFSFNKVVLFHCD